MFDFKKKNTMYYKYSLIVYVKIPGTMYKVI